MLYLKRLKLSQFRSFDRLDLSFEPGLNCIVGRNGIGKTNLLEAIFLLSTGKSFRTPLLTDLIQHGKKAFYIEAEFEINGIGQKLFLSFDGKQKEMRYNQNRQGHFTQLLGLLPSVIYSPLDISLITGLPKDRRRFLNLHIAQKDPLYVYYLARYTKALLQRNTLLKKKQRATLEIWEEEMARASKVIMEKRREATESLASSLEIYHQKLQEREEKPTLTYHPSSSKAGDPLLWSSLREKELMLGYTLLGPHRDDLDIFLDQKLAKQFASEGQKRTLIASMKLAEYRGLESALFLVDDFGVHLDPIRKSLLKEEMALKGQIFLTSPEEPEGLKGYVIREQWLR